MIAWIRSWSLWCLIRPHKWGKKLLGNGNHYKRCSRCDLTKIIRTRKAKE